MISQLLNVHKNEQRIRASKAIPSYMTTAEKLRKIMNMQEIKEMIEIIEDKLQPYINSHTK